MTATVPVDSLMRFLQASPEQREAIDRFLLGSVAELGGGGGATAAGCEPGSSGALEDAVARIERKVDAVQSAVGSRVAAESLAKAVERLDRNMEAVAKGNYELRRENDELGELMKAGGVFQFATQVEPDDFRAFAVIMALGNRKAAADFLKVPHRSFYDRVDNWCARGKDYQRLYRFMEWRKKVGRKSTVRLEDSVQSGEPSEEAENPETISDVLDTIKGADNRDYPAILRQVLEALQKQNPKNWPAVRDELVEMIKEEV